MMATMDDNERLNDILWEGSSPRKQPEAPPPSFGAPTDLDLCQWQVGTNGVFRPAARTVKHLVPGAYTVHCDNQGAFLSRMHLMSDEIVQLPESANLKVLDCIRKFWASRDRYKKHGLVFKRGVLLWGPPGSGKTITVAMLTKDLIDNGGIVVFCSQTATTSYLISAIRRIEKERPLIVVYEDIDEIINTYGEHNILAMLDGEQQTDNVVSVATTNYPERLGARIVNRPSRFDDRIFVGMPSERDRRAYLEKTTTGVDVERWASDTEGLSIAHLRELVAAVMCLDQDYDDVLRRLRTMNERPKEVDGYTKRSPGFGLVNGAVAQQAGRL